MVLLSPYAVQEAAKNTEELRNICKKILQAYRIRMLAMQRRSEILEKVDKKFENLTTFDEKFKRLKKTEKGKVAELQLKQVLEGPEAFYAMLDNLLSRELKMLEVGEEESITGIKKLQYATNLLKTYRNGLREAKTKTINLGHGRVSVEEMKNFFDHMLGFLRKIEDDFHKIKTRMEKEKHLIDERTAESFNRYILAWENEVCANEKLLSHYKRAVGENFKIISRSLTDNRAQWRNVLIILGTSPLTLEAGAKVAKMSGNNLVGALAASVLVMAALVIGMLDTTKSQWFNMNKDEKLLRRIERVEPLKRAMWKRILFARIF